MNLAVLGPGGVGGLLAALLARGGDRVVCLAGEATAVTVRERGLSVRSGALGDFTVPVAGATRLAEPVDACLIAVKAPQLPAALERVPPDLVAGGIVVPLLNGVEHVVRLAARYSRERVVPAAIRVEATRVAPGAIEHASPFLAVELAGTTEPARRLAERLRAAGADVRMRTDPEPMLWEKLARLAPMALLTTHARAPIGAVCTERRAELLAVVGEVAAVAARHGAPGQEADVVRWLDGLPPGMKSSMQRDAEAGRETELDAIGGAVLRAGARAGVELPATARLVAELSPVPANHHERS